MKSKRQPAMPKVGATWEERQLDAGSKRLTLLKWLGKTPTSLWIILAFVFYKPEVTCVSWWQILKSITVFDQEQNTQPRSSYCYCLYRLESKTTSIDIEKMLLIPVLLSVLLMGLILYRFP